MYFAFYKLCTKAIVPIVFAVFTQTAHAATFGSDLSLSPQGSTDTAYLLPISQALNAGEISRAETLVRARLKDAPEDAIAWEVLGVTLALSGDARQADEAYARAVELQPRRLSAWVKRGDLSVASGNIPNALTYWTAALDLSPTYAPAHQRLGQTYASQGDLSRALTHLEAALKVKDSQGFTTKIELALVYNRLGRASDALDLLTGWDDATDTVDPKDTSRIMLALGNAHAQLGDTNAALSHYERGITATPDDNALLLAKGAVLVDTGDAAGAVETLAKPAAAEPANAYSNLQYARALMAQGDSTRAIAAAERAIAAGGSVDITRQALSAVARTHLINRDFPAANNATERLIALLPDDPASWREHAAIRGATGQYEDAKGIYDDALARFKDDAQLLRGRAIVQVRLGNLEAAANDAAAAAVSAPDWLEPLFLLGEIELAREQNAKAEDAFRTALKIAPNHWPSLVNVANLRLLAGDTSAALDLSQRAVDVSGGAEAATAVLAKAQALQ